MTHCSVSVNPSYLMHVRIIGASRVDSLPRVVLPFFSSPSALVLLSLLTAVPLQNDKVSSWHRRQVGAIVEVADRCQVGTLCHVRRPIQSFVHSEISCLFSPAPSPFISFSLSRSLSPRHSTSRSSSLCGTLYRQTYATSKGYELTEGVVMQ